MPFDTQIGVVTSAALLDVAMKHEGIKEWPGAQHNPAILQMGRLAGINWYTRDEIPWCAVFVNAMLAMIGVPGTNSAMARSFMHWGEPVPVNNIRPGDILVFPRDSAGPDAGHVNIVQRVEGANVYCIGGNQSDMVCVRVYRIGDILPNGVRRWDGSGISANRPTLRQGSKGVFVKSLQDQLAELNYFSGKVDGDFGPLTKTAVMALQSDNGLTSDGIVGPRTWAMLDDAAPRKQRDVSASELRERGSRTIRGADRTSLIGGATFGGFTLDAAADAANKAQGISDTVSRLVADHGVELVVGLIALGALLYFTGMIKNARVEDAKSGANLSR